LCGWAAPIKYIRMLESTKINLGTPARFRSASAPGQRRGTSTARRAEPPSISFQGQAQADSRGRPEALGGPIHPQSNVHAWPNAVCRTFRGREAPLEDAYSCSEYAMIMGEVSSLSGGEAVGH
jgi:hypothetical protein